MNDASHYALIILFASAVGLVAVLANRLTERVKVPVALLVLVGAAVAVNALPALHPPSEQTVERYLHRRVGVGAIRRRHAYRFVALPQGGRPDPVGRRSSGPSSPPPATDAALRLRDQLVPLGAGCHRGCPHRSGLGFLVLGKRQIAGRSSTILEGESGANDPVGISLMASLIAAGSLSVAGFASVGTQFVLQMVIGAAVGVDGGRALIVFVRTCDITRSEGLYPLRMLASSLTLYGIATLAQGSGFLAVFVAGIMIGDARGPYQPEVKRFHAALAGLAEIVAFAVLGLTVDLHTIVKPDVWIPGIMLGAALTLLIRPLAVGACLAPVQLQRNERVFVLVAGLKGAVPILLGEFLRAAHVPDAERLYGIVVVVVAFSVLVQGSSVPSIAKLLRLPMRTVEPEPWAIAVHSATTDGHCSDRRFGIIARSYPPSTYSATVPATSGKHRCPRQRPGTGAGRNRTCGR